MRDSGEQCAEVVTNRSRQFWSAVFFSALAVAALFGPIDEYNFPVLNSAHFSIGVAAREDIDISARVAHFYLCAGAFLGLLFTLQCFLRTPRFERFFSSSNGASFSTLALVGSVLCATSLFSIGVRGTLSFVVASQVALLITYLLRGDTDQKNCGIAQLTLAMIMLGILVYGHELGMLVSATVLAVVYTFGLTVLMLLCTGENSLRTVRAVQPLCVLPAVTLLCSELEYFLAARFGMAPSYQVLLGIGAALLLGLVCIRRRRVRGDSKEKGWLLASMMSLIGYALYAPNTIYDGRLFEPANFVLPVQQLFEFGKIPLVTNFPSHALSDFFFPLVHAFFYGYSNLNMLSFSFLETTLAVGVSAAFLWQFSGQVSLAVTLALFSPFFLNIFPAYFAFALVVPLVFARCIERPGFFQVLSLWMACAGLLAWRIDLGTAAVIATLVIAAADSALTPDKQKIVTLLGAAGCAAVICGFIFLSLAIIAGIDITRYVSDILAYLASGQSYGLTDVTPEKTVSFVAQYFLFPLMAVLVFYRIELRSWVRREPQDYWRRITILFLVVFYFVNFQRGIVRHSFLEHDDTKISSFAFFFIPAFFAWCFGSARTSAGWRFAAYSFALAGLFRIAPLGPRASFFEEFIEKLAATTSRPSVTNWLEGPVSATNEQALVGELRTFLDANFPRPATFWDFSNSPMLYYFLHRENPALFPQNTICAHSPDLQRRVLKLFEEHKIPVVLFSRGPSNENSWGTLNSIDGIPGALRHSVLAKYIYDHFVPWGTLNRYSVWIEKGATLPSRGEKSEANLRGQVWESVPGGLRMQLDNPVQLSVDRTYYVRIPFRAPLIAPLQMHARLKNGDREWDQVFETVTSPLDQSILGVWRARDRGVVQASTQLEEIKLVGQSRPSGIGDAVEVFSADYLPDIYSNLFQNWELGAIPRLWANAKQKALASLTRENAEILSAGAGLSSAVPMQLGVPTSSDAFDFLEFEIGNAAAAGTLRLSFGDTDRPMGSFSFKVQEADAQAQSYLIPISAQYNWIHGKPSWIFIELLPDKGVRLPEDVQVKRVRLIRRGSIVE